MSIKIPTGETITDYNPVKYVKNGVETELTRIDYVRGGVTTTVYQKIARGVYSAPATITFLGSDIYRITYSVTLSTDLPQGVKVKLEGYTPVVSEITILVNNEIVTTTKTWSGSYLYRSSSAPSNSTIFVTLTDVATGTVLKNYEPVLGGHSITY